MGKSREGERAVQGAPQRAKVLLLPWLLSGWVIDGLGISHDRIAHHLWVGTWLRVLPVGLGVVLARPVLICTREPIIVALVVIVAGSAVVVVVVGGGRALT